jgi:hypothetical protein
MTSNRDIPPQPPKPTTAPLGPSVLGTSSQHTGFTGPTVSPTSVPGASQPYTLRQAAYDVVTQRPGYRAPITLAEQRTSICNTCPELQPLIRRCKECGCQVDMKARFQNSSCPKGKW